MGYDVVALNTTISGKLPNEIVAPALPKLSNKIHLLNRCTLILNDTAFNHRIPALTQAYDLLALRPTSEKVLSQACRDLECDLISFDLTVRHDYYFKGKTLMQAVERGILVELCYAPAVLANDKVVRQNVIGNATQLIRATKGRGLVLSSEAKKATGCRGPEDVINLAAVWGLGPEKGKDALAKLPRQVCGIAAIKRRSFRGVIDVVYGGEKPAAIKVLAQGQGKTGQKRKADAVDGSTGKKEVATIAKPPSKRELKRRKKAEQLARRQGDTEEPVENNTVEQS